MKAIAALVAFSIVSLQLGAQQVKYTVVKDDPFKPAAVVNVNLFQLDLNSYIDNLRTDNFSVNAGVFGYVDFLPFAGINFNIHKSYLAFGKLDYKNYPGNFELNLGGHFMPLIKTKTKNTRVVLDSKTSKYDGKEVTTTTYVNVMAKVYKQKGVRAGLYQKSGPFNAQDYFGDRYVPTYEHLKIASYGIYAGVVSRSIRNIIIKEETYGRCSNSGGHDIALDVLFIPVNRFTDRDTLATVLNVTDDVKLNGKKAPFGFRLAYTIYQTEVKAFTGKKFGLAATGEFGVKPYQGYFLSAGLGITLIKKQTMKSFKKEKDAVE